MTKAHHHALPLLIAACSAGLSHVATAPCFYQVQLPAEAGAESDRNLVVLQVMPAGHFKPRDGRELPVDSWYIDAASAAELIERFNANTTPIVLDYEHQTLRAEENGQPAPAAGFFRSLEWRDGQGLFATVELTPRARQYVADGEYRYFSPVIGFDKRTGQVLTLLMGALTNNPALDDMAPVALRAAARFALSTEESTMRSRLLLAVCAALAITHANRPDADVENDAIAALDALKDKPDPIAQLRSNLGLGADVGVAEISTAVAALKSKAAGAGEPDPAKFVPIDVVKDLQTKVAELTTTQVNGEVEQLVASGLKDGRLLAGMADWARALGKKDVAELKAYLASAQPIAALAGAQTQGRDPTEDGGAGDGLTHEERAICKATGIDPKDFLANKSKAAAA